MGRHNKRVTESYLNIYLICSSGASKIKIGKVALIIPTYNEAKSIALLINRIFDKSKKNNIGIEIIIIDDNSPDGTGAIADKLAEKYPIRVIHRPYRIGLSSAVESGFKIAKTGIVGVMDADLSHPPELIPQLIAELKDNDIAVGSRYTICGGVETWSFYRRAVSQIAILLTKPLTQVKDPMSGFFFLNRNVIKDINFKSKGYKILLEILVKGEYNKIKEVPYIFKNRFVGSSKLNYKEYLKYLLDILRLYHYKINRRWTK